MLTAETDSSVTTPLLKTMPSASVLNILVYKVASIGSTPSATTYCPFTTTTYSVSGFKPVWVKFSLPVCSNCAPKFAASFAEFTRFMVARSYTSTVVVPFPTKEPSRSSISNCIWALLDVTSYPLAVSTLTVGLESKSTATIGSSPFWASSPSKPSAPSYPIIPSSPSTPSSPWLPSEPAIPSSPATPSSPSTPCSPSSPSSPSSPISPASPASPALPEAPSLPLITLKVGILSSGESAFSSSSI